MTTPLPARSTFDGTATPSTSTMKTALGNLRDYLAALLGESGTVADARIAIDSVSPVFSAYQTGTAQVTPNGTWVKAALNAKEYDTASCYDSTTNFRFTPNVAGYYQVNAAFVAGGASNQSVAIHKNGSVAKYGSSINTNANTSVVSATIFMNGTTDYIEFYVLANTTATFVTGTTGTYFQATMVRSA